VNASTIGAAVGAVLALTWVGFGFWAVLLLGLAMLAGLGATRLVRGDIDLRGPVQALHGRRTSS